MNDLWRQRQRAYRRLLLKYSRYVLNDHFVIALLFILGGFSLGYAQLVQNLTPENAAWWVWPVSGIWLWGWLYVGSITTLLKPPDPIFWLPQEKASGQYIQRAFWWSLWRNCGLQIIGLGIISPLVVRGLGMNSWDLLALGLTQLLLKGTLTLLEYRILTKKRNVQLATKQEYLVLFGTQISCLILALRVTCWGGLALAALCLGVVGITTYRLEDYGIDWQLALAKENSRMARLYRFFNLFTNVPAVQGSIKRRKLWDKLLPQAKGNPYLYCYYRTLVRNPNLSGTYFRLVGVGVLVVLLIPGVWVRGAVAMLCLYLVMNQMLGLASVHRNNLFQYVWPLQPLQQRKALQKVMRYLLGGVTILLVVGVEIVTKNWLLSGGMLVILSCENAVLTGFYLPQKMDKLLDTQK